MVGIGNHEYDHMHGGAKDPSGASGEGFHPWWAPGYGTDSGGECGVPMFHRFHMPETGLALWWYVNLCAKVCLQGCSTYYSLFFSLALETAPLLSPHISSFLQSQPIIL